MLIRTNKTTADNTLPSGMALLTNYLAAYNPYKNPSDLHQAAQLLAQAIQATDDKMKIEKIKAAEAICQVGPIAQSAYAAMKLKRDDLDAIDMNEISLLRAFTHDDTLLPELRIYNYYLLGLTHIKLGVYEVAKHYLIQGMRLEWINNLPPQYAVNDILAALNTIDKHLARPTAEGLASQIHSLLEKLTIAEDKYVGDGMKGVIDIAKLLLEEDDDLHLQAWYKKADIYSQAIPDSASVTSLTMQRTQHKDDEIAALIKKNAEEIFRYLKIPSNDAFVSPIHISELWNRSRFIRIHISLKINLDVISLSDFMKALHINEMYVALKALNPTAEPEMIRKVALWVEETFYAANIGPTGLGAAQKMIIDNAPNIVFPRSFYLLYAHHLMILNRHKEALEQLLHVIPAANQFHQKRMESSLDRTIIKIANYMRATCEYYLEEAAVKRDFQQTIRSFHIALSDDSDIRYPVLSVLGAKKYLEIFFKAQSASEPGMSLERLQTMPIKGGDTIGYIQKLIRSGDRAKALSIALIYRGQNPFVSHHYTYLSSEFYDITTQKFKDPKAKMAAIASWDLNIAASVVIDSYFSNEYITDMQDFRFHAKMQRAWFVFKGEFHLSGLMHQRIVHDMSYLQLVAENREYADSIAKKARGLLNNSDKLLAYEVAYKVFASEQYKAKIIKLKEQTQSNAFASTEEESAPSADELKTAVSDSKNEPEVIANVIEKIPASNEKSVEKNRKEQARKERKLQNRAKRALEAEAEQRTALEKQHEDYIHSLKNRLATLQVSLLKEQSAHGTLTLELTLKERQRNSFGWQIKKMQSASEKALFNLVKKQHRQLLKQTWLIKQTLLHLLEGELVNRDKNISREMQLKAQRKILGSSYQKWVAQKKQNDENLLKHFDRIYRAEFSVKPISMPAKKEFEIEEKDEKLAAEFESSDLLLEQVNIREKALEVIIAKNATLRAALLDIEEEKVLIQEKAVSDQHRTHNMLRKLLEQSCRDEMRQSGEGQRFLLSCFQRLNTPSIARGHIHQYYAQWVSHLKQNHWALLQFIHSELHPTRVSVVYQQPTYEQLQVEYLQQNYVALYNAHAALYSNYCYIYNQGLIEYQNQMTQMQGWVLANDVLYQPMPGNYGRGSYFNFFQPPVSHVTCPSTPNEDMSLGAINFANRG